MSKFIISGFADEIDKSLEKQISVLKRLGISFMELRSIEGVNVSAFTLDYAKDVKRILDDSGIGISAIGSPIGKFHIVNDFSEQLDLFKHVLDISAIYDSRYIRLFSFFLPEGANYDDYEDAVLERLQKFIEAAGSYNVTLLHENEKGIYGDTPDHCYNLLSKLNSKKFRGIFDPANFVQCGAVTYPDAYNLLKDYIDYYHIKDAKMSDGSVVPSGYGDGHLKEIIVSLKERNYEGFMSLEPHLKEFEGFAGLSDETKLGNEGTGEGKFEIAYNALKNLL